MDTAFDDSFPAATGTLKATDPDSKTLTFGIRNGTDNGNGTVSKTNHFGQLTVDKTSGAYSFTPRDIALEILTTDKQTGFIVTVSDGESLDMKDLMITIKQLGTTESRGDDTLTGNAGDNRMKALAGNDKVYGLDGNDDLIGNQGDDVLYGGSGNDVLHGGQSDDTLIGNAGNDLLNGSSGNDMLTGGAGHDRFRFAGLLGDIDTLTDFKPAADTIQLQNRIFTALTETGRLNADFFVTAAKAQDGNDYLIYNPDTGVLLYDTDGNGTAAAVQIATLGVDLSLTHKDFVVI